MLTVVTGGPPFAPLYRAKSYADELGRLSRIAEPSVKTLGGRQFWSDVRFFRGWRIQRNAFTGHFRLLDPRDHRHVFGSFETCHSKLEEIKRREQFPPMSGKAVIVIHGIFQSSRTFAVMTPALAKAGYTVVGFNYPSSQIEITEAANDLKQVIDSLAGIDEINFVVHSMGGLVTRAYLRENRDPRIKRMVMLGVPNRGAEMADLVRKNYAYRLVFGPAGQQLVTGPEGLIARLPIPDFEFAVIAGARPPRRLQSTYPRRRRHLGHGCERSTFPAQRTR